MGGSLAQSKQDAEVEKYSVRHVLLLVPEQPLSSEEDATTSVLLAVPRMYDDLSALLPFKPLLTFQQVVQRTRFSALWCL